MLWEGGNPTPSAVPETTAEGISIGRGGREDIILLLETERTDTTTGGVLSAEEGATALDNLGSETEETRRIEPSRDIFIFKFYFIKLENKSEN